jgi:hypothetical protein
LQPGCKHGHQIRYQSAVESGDNARQLLVGGPRGGALDSKRLPLRPGELDGISRSVPTSDGQRAMLVNDHLPPNTAVFEEPFVVRYHDHRSAKPTHDARQKIHIGQVEIVGRLVEQQKLWLLRAQEPACAAERNSATVTGSASWRCGNRVTEPFRRTVPSVGSRSPARIRARCVLPTPFGPTSADSPASSDKFRLLKRLRPLENSYPTPRAQTIADMNNLAHRCAPPPRGKNEEWAEREVATWSWVSGFASRSRRIIDLEADSNRKHVSTAGSNPAARRPLDLEGAGGAVREPSLMQSHDKTNT